MITTKRARGRPVSSRKGITVCFDPDVLDRIERTPYGSRSDKINRLLKIALDQQDASA